MRTSLLAILVAAALPSHADAPLELNLGTQAAKGTPGMDLLERFEREIELESEGRINVILRPPGMTGEREMVAEVRGGERLQGCSVSAAALARAGDVPQLALVELPFLFTDDREATFVLDEVLFDSAAQLLAGRDLVLATWSENGWRSFATRGRAVLAPADLLRMRMRAQDSPVHAEMYGVFGALAVDLPITEVASALQSGALDGFDETALVVHSAGLTDALDHFTVTRHIYQPTALVFSKRWFDALPPDLQRLVASKRSLGPSSRAAIHEAEQDVLQRFEVFGVEVHELTPAQREAFATVARGSHAAVAAKIEGGTALLTKIRDGVARYRGTALSPK